MSNPGVGAFHVFYTGHDGSERRKAYRTFDEASNARDFLESLGYEVGIEMSKTRKVWKPE